MPTDTLVTPTELSAWLSIPPKTLAEWRSRGIGPKFLRVGRHVRYRRADIETYLDQIAVEPRHGQAS